MVLPALAAFALQIFLLSCGTYAQGTRPVFLPVTVGDCRLYLCILCITM